MNLSLFVPIETPQKKVTVTMDVPSRKSNKDIVCDLRPFIVGGGSDDISEELRNSIDDEVESNDDEEFVNSFTLSHFRKDLMLLT